MPYSVDKYNGTTVAVVEDGTIDSTLDIKLIGKNYAGYGEVQNENFVHMLENFAGASQPPRPISGQIWYDTGVKKLKFFDSTTARWKTTGGAEVAASAPAGLAIGDFWYDSSNRQVYVYDGSNYVLVGPQGVAGLGTTQMKSLLLTDNSTGASHAAIQAIVDGEVMFVVSQDDSYTLSTESAIPGFSVIHPGITLVGTANSDGITDGDPYASSDAGRSFWGTVTNAMKLNGFGSDDFILKTSGEVAFDVVVRFADAGYTVGDSNDLQVKIDVDGSTPLIKNALTNTIKFQTTTVGTGATNTPLILAGNDLLPGTDITGNLGSTLFRFNNVYGQTFSGTAAKADQLKDGGGIYRSATSAAVADTVVVRDASANITATQFLGNATTATSAVSSSQSDSLLVGAAYRTASVDTPDTGTPNSIACRDSSGNLNAVIFQGTATSALFADLAEKYLADQEYETGTVVMVGGEAEVTACSIGDRAFGAVSANPAFMMNEGLEGGTYIALKGRVPVKVVGAVRKGDRLIAANNGCAGVSHTILKNLAIRAGSFPDTFAIALESSDDEGVKLVECIIL